MPWQAIQHCRLAFVKDSGQEGETGEGGRPTSCGMVDQLPRLHLVAIFNGVVIRLDENSNIPEIQLIPHNISAISLI